MADSKPVSKPHSLFESLVINTGKSTAAWRCFDVVPKTGERREMWLRVGPWRTASATDAIIHKMNDTLAPIADMKAAINEMDGVIHNYELLEGTTVDDVARLFAARFMFSNSQSLLQEALAVDFEASLSDPELGGKKVGCVSAATEHASDGAERLAQLVCELRDREVDEVSDERKNSDLLTLDSADALIELWNEGFQRGMFV